MRVEAENMFIEVKDRTYLSQRIHGRWTGVGT